jgi:glycine cleavage system H protein
MQFTKEHEWVSSTSSQNVYRIGITDFALSALGDIVYVQLPKLGQAVTAGAVCGEIESTKSVSEIFAPVTGKVVAINEALSSSPELINSDPYNAGWLAHVELSEPATDLMSADDYGQITA